MQDLQALYNDLTENYQIPAEDARCVASNVTENQDYVFNVRSPGQFFFSLRHCTEAMESESYLKTLYRTQISRS